MCFFFFKQKTAYEIGTGDWSSDVCSSDLGLPYLIFLMACITSEVLFENVLSDALFLDVREYTKLVSVPGSLQ